jgi:predicted chitinase
MSTITDQILGHIMTDASPQKRAAALPILNSVAAAYDIVNQHRVAAWLATLAVESGELRYEQEIASGAAYEGRVDLGNTHPGDGERFKGRGRIQITGRTNYEKYTQYLKGDPHLPFVDFIQNPLALATEPYATDSAGWFFAVYINANPLADKGLFLDIQVKVNGRNMETGLPNNWAQRNEFYQRGLAVLPAGFQLDAAPAPPAPDTPPPPDTPPAPVVAPVTIPVTAPASDPATTPAAPRLLKPGDEGADVKAMQDRLIHYRFLLPPAVADGVFGPETEAAVKHLQTDHHITVDGEVGPVTYKILFD